MDSFPSEFSDLINKRKYSQLRSTVSLRRARECVVWFPLLVKPRLVPCAIDLLDRHLSPFLKPWQTPIPRTTITKMRANYSEVLPKTVSALTVSFNNARSPAHAAARQIGLITMLRSLSLKTFAEAVSGFSLNGDPGLQAIQYRSGHYVGPHNDHHPEDANLRQGFVDLQITLTNAAVARQLFIYEAKGYLNQPVNVGVSSGVSVSKLPFWHQVTPLQAKPGLEQDAKRWLLLVSWSIRR